MSLVDRSHLLRALSLDSQARTTTDPNRPVQVGTGDGVTRVFDTPFLEATTLKGYVGGALVTGTVLKKATGADGVDQIQFSTAPASGEAVSVSADGLAINLAVLEEVLDQAEAEMEGSVRSAGYSWPVTGDALRILTPKIVSEVKELLRFRRDLDVPRNAAGRTPQEQWRFELATGKVRLPINTPVESQSLSSTESLAYGSDETVFSGVAL